MSDLFSDAVREKDSTWNDFFKNKKKVKSVKEIMGDEV